MIPRMRMEINWSIKELEQLVNDENSCIHFQRAQRHLGLHPFHLNDLNKGICEILSARINLYDPELKGLILACKNPTLLSSLGGILHDSHYVHIDVAASFYYFKPEVGTTLRGIITKIGENHLGAVVHKTFNVSLPGDGESPENWLGNHLSVSDPVTFTVTRIDFKGGLPFIRGKIIPNAELEDDDESMDTSVVSTKKKKSKKSIIKPPTLKSVDSSLENEISNSDHDDEDGENEIATKEIPESPLTKYSNKIPLKLNSSQEEDDDDEVIPNSQSSLTMSQSKLKRKKKALLEANLARQQNDAQETLNILDHVKREEKIEEHEIKKQKEGKTKKKSSIHDSIDEVVESLDQCSQKSMKNGIIASKKKKETEERESLEVNPNEDDDEVIPNSQSSPTMSQSKLKRKKKALLEASLAAQNGSKRSNALAESTPSNIVGEEKIIESKNKKIKESKTTKSSIIRDPADGAIDSPDRSSGMSPVNGKKVSKKSKKESSKVDSTDSDTGFIQDSESFSTMKKSKLKNEKVPLEASPKKRNGSQKNMLEETLNTLKHVKDEGEKENGIINMNKTKKTKGISIIQDQYPADQIIEFPAQFSESSPNKKKTVSKRLETESPMKSTKNSNDEGVTIKDEQINTKKKKNSSKLNKEDNDSVQIQKYAPLDITRSRGNHSETITVKMEAQSDVETTFQKKIQQKMLKKEDSSDNDVSPVKKEPVDRPKKAKKRKAEIDVKDEQCKSENDILPKKKLKTKFTE